MPKHHYNEEMRLQTVELQRILESTRTQNNLPTYVEERRIMRENGLYSVVEKRVYSNYQINEYFLRKALY
jgi:hypothetical protein